MESFAGSGVLDDLKYVLGDTVDLIPASWLPLKTTLQIKDVCLISYTKTNYLSEIVLFIG